jgi:hypothetical protein
MALMHLDACGFDDAQLSLINNYYGTINTEKYSQGVYING